MSSRSKEYNTGAYGRLQRNMESKKSCLQALYIRELFKKLIIYGILTKLQISNTLKKYLFFNSQQMATEKTFVFHTQPSHFSTVNSSTVPITSWPLMFANSSLTACYVREVRRTCGDWALFTSSTTPETANCLPAFPVYGWALTKRAAKTSRWPGLTPALR